MKRTLIISLTLLALVGACSFFTSGYETDESIRNEIPKGYLGNLKTTPTPVPTPTPISEESLKQKVLDLEEELKKIKEDINCDFAKNLTQRGWSRSEGRIDNYEEWVLDAKRLSELINSNDFWFYPSKKIGEPYSISETIEEFASHTNLIEFHFNVYRMAAGSVLIPPGLGSPLKGPNPIIENNCK